MKRKSTDLVEGIEKGEDENKPEDLNKINGIKNSNLKKRKSLVSPGLNEIKNSEEFKEDQEKMIRTQKKMKKIKVNVKMVENPTEEENQEASFLKLDTAQKINNNNIQNSEKIKNLEQMAAPTSVLFRE